MEEECIKSKVFIVMSNPKTKNKTNEIKRVSVLNDSQI